MTRAGGLLAVHAHPDDETLATGALLATWAAAGRLVTVVTCTRGEQGEVIPAELAHLEGDGPGLARHRTGELEEALAALGVTRHVWLDALLGEPVTDSGMAWAEPGRAAAAEAVPPHAFVSVDVEVAAQALTDLLVAERPAVVACYEPDGGYGHPDHVQAHRVTTRAVELARERDPHLAPVVLWAAVDAAELRAGRLRLTDVPVPGGLVRADPDGARPSAVVEPDDVDLRVDAVAVRDRVVAALAAHATQVRVVDHDGAAVAYALSNDVVEPLLPVESYRVVDGDPDGVAWPSGIRR